MTLLNDAEAIYLGTVPVERVYVGATQVWPASEPPPEPEPATVETFARPTGAPAAPAEFTVTVDGSPTAVYGTREGFFANFAFTGGTVEVVVTHNAAVASAAVLPAEFGVPATVSGSTVTFSLDTAQNYVVQINGTEDPSELLYVFANPLLPKPDPASVTYYYGPGYYEGTTPSGGWLAGQNLVLGAGESAYFDGAAYFAGHVNLGTPDGIVQTGPRVSNVHVSGYGVIDSTHPAVTGKGRPSGITQVATGSLKGVTLIGEVHWGCIIAECDGVTVEHAKMVNCLSVTGTGTPDGFDIIGSSNVTYRNTFVRATDDALAIKTFKRGFGTASPSGWAGSVENVLHEGLVIVNGPGGNGSEIGYENFATQQNGGALTRVPEFIRGITYRDHHIIWKIRDPAVQYRMAGLGIHLVDRVPLSDVLYEDVWVGEIITGQFSIWFGSFLTSDYDDLPDAATAAARAPITGVTLRRVTIGTGTDVLPIHLQGGDVTKPIDGLTFEDVIVNGHKITGPGSVAGKYTWEESNVTGWTFL